MLATPREVLKEMYPGEDWRRRVDKMPAKQVEAIMRNKMQGGSMPMLVHETHKMINNIYDTSKREEIRNKLYNMNMYYEIVVLQAEIRSFIEAEQKYGGER